MDSTQLHPRNKVQGGKREFCTEILHLKKIKNKNSFVTKIFPKIESQSRCRRRRQLEISNVAIIVVGNWINEKPRTITPTIG